MKLILDTDIGTDVDDAWALALCLASEEIELLGVTLVHADLDTRAAIARKMLVLAGRRDIPVYKGLSEPLTPGAKLYWGGHEGAGTDFSDVEGVESEDGAVDFILDSVQRYPGEVVVCAIGPETNVGEAIRRSHGTMSKVKRLAIMGSTFNGEGRDVAGVEHNIRLDTDAARLVLQSGIPATVVGLNVTTKVTIARTDLPVIEASPLGRYLADMTRRYYNVIGKDSTWLHDPLAVAALIDPSIVQTQRMAATEVLDDGGVVYESASESGTALDVCVDVDVDRFHRLLLAKLHSLAAEGD